MYWTPNFDMVVGATNSVGAHIELDLYDFKISGLVRVEIELCDEITPLELPFKLMRFAFMKPPMIDISVAFGQNVDKQVKASQIGLTSVIREVQNIMYMYICIFQ